ncbi:hypothetical protein LINGRAHAP2_LOCUS1600 [Linum grandiflorum]
MQKVTEPVTKTKETKRKEKPKPYIQAHTHTHTHTHTRGQKWHTIRVQTSYYKPRWKR